MNLPPPALLGEGWGGGKVFRETWVCRRAVNHEATKTSKSHKDGSGDAPADRRNAHFAVEAL